MTTVRMATCGSRKARRYIASINVSTGSIIEYPVPTAGAAPTAITLSEGGDAWFTEPNANRSARSTRWESIWDDDRIPGATANSKPFASRRVRTAACTSQRPTATRSVASPFVRSVPLPTPDTSTSFRFRPQAVARR